MPAGVARLLGPAEKRRAAHVLELRQPIDKRLRNGGDARRGDGRRTIRVGRLFGSRRQRVTRRQGQEPERHA